MNAMTQSQEFAVTAGPPSEWLVLRCQSSRTLALAAALAEYGAWTPTWKRKRRLPRSPISRVVTEAALPSFVFIPAAVAFDLPHVPQVSFSFMRGAEFELIRVPDRQLEPMRRIADKPLVSARKLPRPGLRVRFTQGPFEGLRGKVLACSIAYATVAVEGWALPVQVPPVLLAVDA